MPFEIIRNEDLSKEQLEVLNRTAYSDLVVEGGPGTGKTSLAIMRARRFFPQSTVLVLVYNRPLMLYLQSALQANTGWGFNADTYHNWLGDFYRNTFGCAYPCLDKFEPDWEKIEPQMTTLGKKYQQIIIDEGQDFPLPLLRILRSLTNHITVFIDPMQAMEDSKTKTEEAAAILHAPVLRLTTNYRSTEEITEFSNLFRSEGKVLPNKMSDGELPVIAHCANYEKQTKKIVEIIVGNSSKEIGIIANAHSVKHLYGELSELIGKQFNIQYYLSQQDNNLDFDVPAVRIVTYGTMKGLEFDVVILPRFTRVRTTGDDVADMNRLHVATSRAKEKLYLLCFYESADKEGYINTIAPLAGRTDLYYKADL